MANNDKRRRLEKLEAGQSNEEGQEPEVTGMASLVEPERNQREERAPLRWDQGSHSPMAPLLVSMEAVQKAQEGHTAPEIVEALGVPEEVARLAVEGATDDELEALLLEDRGTDDGDG